MADEDTGCEGWTHGTLLTYFRAKIREMDLRYEQRFRAQETAIDKAEKAQEARNQTLNELRGIVTDQQGSFARTTVVNLQIEAIAMRLAAAELNMRGLQERGGGSKEAWREGAGYIFGAISLIIAALAIYFKH